MKKMNLKRNLALATSAFALSAAFVGCTDYNAFSEAELQQEAKLQEYYNNFVKEFGEPDPNHTWGWEGMTPELADAILGESATRASYNPGHDPINEPGYAFDPDEATNKEGRILVNRNQWAEWDGSTNDYATYSIARMVHIPGWPNEDGQYIAEGTPVAHGSKYSGMPKGDISEYEIQYVSWYMRNHQFDPNNPGASKLQLVDLHVSEFFIQQVSHDKDYETYTPQGAAKSMSYFGGGDDWSMNALKFKALDGNWTHINNFNGNENDAPQTHIGNNNGRVIQYVMSSGTEDFDYHSTTSTGGYTFDKWVMVKIEWDEPRNPDWSSIHNQTELETYLAKEDKGDTFHREGYYLCFDFQADKNDNNSTHPEMDYPGDNVYSNWILKITPGKQVQIDRWPKRLMCEDLGNTYDFDFNDAVFDLFFQENANESGWYDCIVTLQAAGGTMPTWVAINPNELPAGYSREAAEIHKLLGSNPATTPVNVIKGGAKAPFASYRVKKLFQKSDEPAAYVWNEVDGKWEINTDYSPTEALMTLMAAAAFKLSIYIQTPSGMQTVSGYNIFKTLRDSSPAGYNNGEKSTSYVPQLFNCSVDAKWTYENGHIKDAYKHFAEWVANEQGNYRLRWDRDGYYARSEGTGVESVGHVDHEESVKTSWLGSWDYGPKGATSWGSDGDWIDKSKCWGGNGPE